jgi:predicted RNase H-like HicB family nuclease
MKTYTAVIERDKQTGLYVGYVPGIPGAHSQGETLDELHDNLREVLEMLGKDEALAVEGDFVGTQDETSLLCYSGRLPRT